MTHILLRDAPVSSQAQRTGTETNPDKGFWDSVVHDPVAAFTGLLFLATMALGIFTYRLWKATLELAKDARDNSTDQADKMERSIEQATRSAKAMEAMAVSNATNSAQIAESVSLSRKAMRTRISVLIGGATYQERDVKFEARPQIVNRGATEARDVRWKIDAAILPTPIPADFKFPLPKESFGGSVIGPQGEGTISAIVADRVPSNQVEAIKIGTPHGLVVWGFVAYRDIFGKRHLTTFCQLMYWKQVAKKRAFRSKPQAPFGYYLPMHNHSS